jgi:hypothetical protein
VKELVLNMISKRLAYDGYVRIDFELGELFRAVYAHGFASSQN